MKRLLIILVVFMVNICKGQDLEQSDHLAPIRSSSDKWGYVDKTEKEVIPFKYDMVYGFKKE
jgi:hypothetical protein